MIDDAAEIAQREFAERGEVNPMWIADTATGERLMIPGLLPNELMVVALRAIFRDSNVVRYVTIQEAWMAKLSSEEMATFDGPVREHPDRREVIFFHAEDKQGCVFARYFILRPEHGKPTLSPLQYQGVPDGSDGRLTGLLARD
jgi:hypothetical protein